MPCEPISAVDRTGTDTDSAILDSWVHIGMLRAPCGRGKDEPLLGAVSQKTL
jgi:hypothetical protein